MLFVCDAGDTHNSLATMGLVQDDGPVTLGFSWCYASRLTALGESREFLASDLEPISRARGDFGRHS